MVDMGGNFTGYMTDMTRVFSVGKLPDLAYRAHDTSLEIQRRIAEAAQPARGHRALRHRRTYGRRSRTIGILHGAPPAGRLRRTRHRHRNQRDAVLAPRSKEILAEGMVFALEPKFVIPGVGAVGIENSFAVTAAGSKS